MASKDVLSLKVSKYIILNSISTIYNQFKNNALIHTKSERSNAAFKNLHCECIISFSSVVIPTLNGQPISDTPYNSPFNKCYMNDNPLSVAVPVTGNYTDLVGGTNSMSEFDTIPELEKEYPLQRDEVKSTPNKANRSTAKVPMKNAEVEGSNHYIGFIIGTLTVLILILVRAIDKNVILEKKRTVPMR